MLLAESSQTPDWLTLAASVFGSAVLAAAIFDVTSLRRLRERRKESKKAVEVAADEVLRYYSVKSGSGGDFTVAVSPDAEVDGPGPDNKPVRKPEPEPTEFVAFWKYTQNRLDDYHAEGLRQLKVSYFLAQIMTLLGFLVVLGSAYAAAQAEAGAQAAAAAAVGTVGAALAAYISKTINKSYELAMVRSTGLFNEPVFTARKLAAERLLDKLNPDTAEYSQAVLKIIEATVDPAADITETES